VSQQPPASSHGGSANPVSAVTNYGAIPLAFEANRGQTDPSVQFLSHGQGYTLFIREGEAVLALRRAKPTGAIGSSPADPRGIARPLSSEIETSFVQMKLAGANSHAAAHQEDEQVTKTNYFIGSDPAKWRTDIPNYSRVHYTEIYPGIDLVYYGNQRQLEHDFVVGPGADPSRIRLDLMGAKQLRIDAATGDLILKTGAGELRLLKPVTFQESNGKRTWIDSRYKLLAGNRVAFIAGTYNHAQPLVIDPVLVYSTYLGGSGSNYNGRTVGDQGNGIAVDAAGSAYVVGTTYSANFPMAGRSIQSQNFGVLAGDGGTVFVSKLNAAGTALVYSTYLGGSGGDFGYGIALDSANNAYITGATFSRDFPTTCGSYQISSKSIKNHAPTGFVAKLSPTGSALEYATYLGGSGVNSEQGDVPQAIAVDASGNAYLVGYTFSKGFPVTNSAFQVNHDGSASNAFVTKLNPGGSALVYSTFLGGSGLHGVGDFGNAIAIDKSGHAFVAGSTNSSNFPVTRGAYQTVDNGSLRGQPTAFITELNVEGTGEVYSTFLGGNGGDSAQAIAIDHGGFAYVAGTTSSGDFPLTDGVLEGTDTGLGAYFGAGGVGTGAFVTKLNQDGSALEYSTYMEGEATVVTALAVDSSGRTYITGSAPTAGVGHYGGFMETLDALPTPASKGNAAFLVKLNPAAESLEYATLLGGDSDDGAVALALDGVGNVYLTGFAASTNFPPPAGPSRP
jgi:hypothetical protein